MSTYNDILHEYLQVSRHITEKFRVYYGKLNLTYPQSIVLAILEADGPMPISALAEAAGSANSTISGVLDRLEQMDLIQRVRSERDRRVVYVNLTPHFEEVQEELEGSVLESFPGLIEKLSPEEVEQVRTGLTVLERALKREE